MESPQFSVDVRTSWTLATFRERSGYVEENLGAARNRSWQAQAYRFELGLDRTESRLQRFTVSVGLESERTLSDGPEEFRFTASFKTDMTQLTLLRQGIVTLLQLIARNLPER
ncbi:MAG TPA: hypothetical protein VGN57_05910 [Pirellulaceae bacterium]|nr:hypothetical protein [Pirellulaceae bacterium]